MLSAKKLLKSGLLAELLGDAVPCPLQLAKDVHFSNSIGSVKWKTVIDVLK